jgi:hypothetical protein
MGCGIPSMDDIKNGINKAKVFVDEETKSLKKVSKKAKGEKKSKPKKSGETKKSEEGKKKKETNKNDT